MQRSVAVLPKDKQVNVFQEISSYAANIRKFKKDDWLRYTLWIGSIFGLLFATTGVTVFGAMTGTVWPAYVWWIPIGTFMFCGALALDDIGHRTLYKKQLAKGERYVHQMIAGTAVPSVVFLCLSFQHPEIFRVPALVLILLSFFYSALDEGMHWVRYYQQGLDRVEMWSHFVAITGHALMIGAWWHWLDQGYPGLQETLARLSL
jgi:hypothetical protein